MIILVLLLWDFLAESFRGDLHLGFKNSDKYSNVKIIKLIESLVSFIKFILLMRFLGELGTVIEILCRLLFFHY